MSTLRSLAARHRLRNCNGLAQGVESGTAVFNLTQLTASHPSSLCGKLTNSNSFSTYESPQLNLVPMVIERTQRCERSFDIFSRLLRDRIVSLTGPIDDRVSHLIVAQLLYLESEAPEKPVSIACYPNHQVEDHGPHH